MDLALLNGQVYTAQDWLAFNIGMKIFNYKFRCHNPNKPSFYMGYGGREWYGANGTVRSAAGAIHRAPTCGDKSR
jgi:hypothetical protein